jgi:hypothetical protein
VLTVLTYGNFIASFIQRCPVKKLHITDFKMSRKNIKKFAAASFFS